MRKKILGLAIIALALFAACPKPQVEPARPTIMVKVCLASGQLAGQYCPAESVAERRYYKEPKPGEPIAPTVVCTLHKAAEPPAPKPSVRVWVGVYDVLVADGDWRAYLARAKAEGATGIRLFASFAWNGPGTRPYLPAAYVEDVAQKIREKDPNDLKTVVNRGGVMTLVRESGAEFPIVDYTLENPAYWTHLREIMNECKRIGLEVWVVMLDYSTLKTGGDPKYWSEWYCAVQRMIPGVTNGTWGDSMKPWIQAFYARVMQEVLASGADYLAEDMNEGWALGWDQAFVSSWFKWSHQALLNAGADPAKIVSTVSLEEIAKLGAFYSPHQIGSADQVQGLYGLPPARLIWSSDGWKTGDGGADAHGGRGVGIEAAKALCARILAIGGYGFELLPREAYSQNNDRANLALIGPFWAVVHALAFGN